MISITTKTGSGPPRATATIEGGSHGTFNQTAGLSGSQDRISYAFNVAHFQATDVPVTPAELLPPGQKAIGNWYDSMTYSDQARRRRRHRQFRRQRHGARYTDATLRFTGDTAGFPSVPSPTQATQQVRQIFTRTEGVWSLFDGRFKNYFGVNYTSHWTFNNDPNFGISSNTGERVKYDWRGVLNVMPGQTLVMGAEHATEQLNTATVFAQNTNNATYLELQSEFAKQLFIVSNVRFDDNDQFGSHMTYRVAPAYIIPGTDTKLKASYGTGFKAPTLSQLYVDFPSFLFFANPNLKPEESTGYDAGFEQPIGDRFRFGATYFHNDITNLINTVSDPTTFRSTYVNIGRAQTEGVETFAALERDRQSQAARRLHLHARRGSIDRPPVAAPAEGQGQPDRRVESVCAADRVRHSSLCRQLPRCQPRFHGSEPDRSRLHRRQSRRGLRRQRPAQDLRPDRQPVRQALPGPHRLPAARLRCVRRHPRRELWCQLARDELRLNQLRHPEERAKQASKDARPGPSSFEGRATHGHLRMTDYIGQTVSHHALAATL